MERRNLNQSLDSRCYPREYSFADVGVGGELAYGFLRYHKIVEAIVEGGKREKSRKGEKDEFLKTNPFREVTSKWWPRGNEAEEKGDGF